MDSPGGGHHEEVSCNAQHRGARVANGPDPGRQGPGLGTGPCPHPPQADQAEGGPAWADGRIAEAIDVSVATVERVRRRLVKEGLDAAPRRMPQEGPSRPPKLDGRAEAKLVALACAAPPKGRKCWTMRLLADKLVELDVVESIGPETVRMALKKKRASRGCGSGG